MSTPDVRVRLTAEGVKEVVDALRQVQRQGAAANRESAAGLNALRNSATTLRSVLGALGITATVAGLAALGRSSFTAANQMIDTARRIDVSVESLSRLAFAANKTNIEFATLEASADTLQKNISKAITDPAGDAAQAFRQIGLDAAALKGLALEDQFGRIADRVANLRSSEDQLRATQDLLGKGNGEMVVLLRQGSTELRNLAEEADRAGATLTESTAAGIDQADAAIKRLKVSASSITRETLAGLSIMVLGPPDEIQRLDKEIEGLQKRRDQLLSSGGGLMASKVGPGRGFAEARAEVEEIDKAIVAALKKQQELLDGGSAAKKPPPTGNLDLVVQETEAERRLRLTATESRIEAELRLEQQGLSGLQDAQKRAFDAGLISVAQYYASRRAIIQAGIEAEKKAAAEQISAIQAVKPADKTEQQALASRADKVRSDLALSRLQAEQQLADLAGEEAERQRAVGREQVALFNTLDELEGNRHSVFARNLAEEQRALRELLTAAGASKDEIEATAARLEQARTAQFNADDVRRRGDEALTSFNRDADQIRRDQESGLITQLEGENRLIALEKSRLVVLTDIAEAYLAAARATGDPAAIAQAQQFADSVKEIDASFRGATNEASKFRQGFQEGLQGGLTDLLSSTQKIHDLGDAFISLAQTVAQSMQRIAAELLSRSITQGITNILGLFGIPGLSAKAEGGPLPAKAKGGAIDARGGGMLYGPGTPTSDDLLLWGSRDEYMIRARAAQQPGAESFLAAFNSGAISMDDIRAAMTFVPKRRTMPRLAAGGPVGDLKPAGAGPLGGRFSGVIGMDEGLYFRHLRSDGAMEILAEHIQRNPARFSSLLKA